MFLSSVLFVEHWTQCVASCTILSRMFHKNPSPLLLIYLQRTTFLHSTLNKKECLLPNLSVFLKKDRYLFSAILTEHCIIPETVANYLRLGSETCGLKGTCSSSSSMCLALQSSSIRPQFSTVHKRKRSFCCCCCCSCFKETPLMAV